MGLIAEYLKPYVLSFVPLFFAVNAAGILPVFVGLTDGLTPAERRRTIGQSLVTALAVAVGFIFLGQAVFRIMGITDSDFKLAGGVLLFIIATLDILGIARPGGRTTSALGAVPLGTPIIAGPAVLTTALILVESQGYAATLVAALANILLVGLLLAGADYLMRLPGEAGSKVASKVAGLMLAAIAIMMIRMGLAAWL